MFIKKLISINYKNNIIKKPLLIPIIGHGATNIINYPLQTISLNIICYFLIDKLSLERRKILLIIFSIYHINDDYFFINKYINLIITIFFHIIWIYYPIIAQLYLSLIHTPMHYLNIIINYKNFKIYILFGLLISLFSFFCLYLNKYDKYLDNNLGAFWYVGPIVSHIIINKIEFKNRLRYF